MSATRSRARWSSWANEADPPGAARRLAYRQVERNGRPVGEGDGVRYDSERHVLVVPFAGPTHVRVEQVTSLF